MLVNKDTLIGKYLSGNTTPEEVKKLTDWLKQDPSNQAEFDSIQKFWNASLGLKKERDADVENAWNEFKSLTETQPEIKVQKTNYNWMSIAAAVALFVVTAGMVKLFMNKPSHSTPAISSVVRPSQEPVAINTPDMSPVTIDSLASQEEPVKNPTRVTTRKFAFPSNSSLAMITVVAGDSAEIFMLPDNSIVYLNANSRLEYPKNYNKTNRHVSLIGEAYFDVKKDSAEFVVSCEKTIIKGRATMFNVKSRATDKEVEVIVASGSVEFSGVGYKDVKKLVLKKGESGYYNKAKSELVRSKHQRKNYRWWEKKSLRAMIKDFFDRLLGKKH